MGKKNKKHSLSIQDFFGTFTMYRIFSMKSDFSVFNVANKLSQALDVTFTVLPDFDYVSDKLSAKFTIFYAEYCRKESIHCFLLENKTKTNQQELFGAKTEKKPHLINYSLFEESLYLFNNNGLRCFEIKFSDLDYLLLVFTKKDVENDRFSQFSSLISSFKANDISYILEKEQTSAEAKTASFLKDFLCKYEVNANQFSERKKLEILSPVKQIPPQNLLYRITIPLENKSLKSNSQISEEYLALLMED